MSYYSKKELSNLGFKSIGSNVKISRKASIYDCQKIEISSNSRIDDFCVVSGKLKIGSNVHITPMCLIAGGTKGIVMEDFVTIAYGVKVFSQSDDYHGESLTNSTIPGKFKNEIKHEVLIKKHTIIGAGSTILPGVVLEEGTSIGAMSLVTKSTTPWSIYLGIPAMKIRDRAKYVLEKERQYLITQNKS